MTGCGFVVDVLSVIGGVIVLGIAGFILYAIIRFWIEGQATIRQMYPDGYCMAGEYQKETKSALAEMRDRRHSCAVTWQDYQVVRERLDALESAQSKKAKKS